MEIIPFTPNTAMYLERLLQEDNPIPTRLWAILDGTIKARILVDEPVDPKFMMVQDLVAGPTYIGYINQLPDLQDAFAILRSYQELVVCLWSDSPIIPMLPTGADYEGIAIDFWDRSTSVNLDHLAEIPSGYHIQKIDEELAPQIEGFDYYIKMFGGFEQAIQNMIGYCLMHGETIVCEVVASPLTRGVAEMSVDTHEDYRHKGLGTITSAYVIRECEAQGYRAFWGTSQKNAASVALARRLGFQTERTFTVLSWSETNLSAA
ncbi:MAG: GNAT family N-acetyltransferase [Methanothrix sp.]|nr:GNAT family N-acetyltransferase [Methanothrix sp.]